MPGVSFVAEVKTPQDHSGNLRGWLNAAIAGTAALPISALLIRSAIDRRTKSLRRSAAYTLVVSIDGEGASTTHAIFVKDWRNRND